MTNKQSARWADSTAVCSWVGCSLAVQCNVTAHWLRNKTDQCFCGVIDFWWLVGYLGRFWRMAVAWQTGAATVQTLLLCRHWQQANICLKFIKEVASNPLLSFICVVCFAKRNRTCCLLNFLRHKKSSSLRVFWFAFKAPRCGAAPRLGGRPQHRADRRFGGLDVKSGAWQLHCNCKSITVEKQRRPTDRVSKQARNCLIRICKQYVSPYLLLQG